MKKTSKIGLSLAAVSLPFIISLEGNVNKVYRDIAGVPTVGAGVVVKDLPIGTILPWDKVDKMNEQAVRKFADKVDKTLPKDQPTSFKMAHVSLAYNIGIGGWQGSTALKRAKAGDLLGSCKALTWWNKVTAPKNMKVTQYHDKKGVKHAKRVTFWVKAGEKYPADGLINRRAKEYAKCIEDL